MSGSSRKYLSRDIAERIGITVKQVNDLRSKNNGYPKGKALSQKEFDRFCEIYYQTRLTDEEKHMVESGQLIDTKEACCLLNVSRNLYINPVYESIRRIKKNGNMFFYRADIESFLCDKKHTYQYIAERLGITVQGVRNLKSVNRHLPKGSLIGRVFYFSDDEVQAYCDCYYSKHPTPEEQDQIEKGELFNTINAAKYLGVYNSVFSRWNWREKGLPYFQKGGQCFFKRSDLDALKKSGVKIKATKTPEQKRQERERERKEELYLREGLAKKKTYEPHECSRPGCQNITENRMLCDSCLEKYAGCVGDN